MSLLCVLPKPGLRSVLSGLPLQQDPRACIALGISRCSHCWPLLWIPWARVLLFKEQGSSPLAQRSVSKLTLLLLSIPKPPSKLCLPAT